METSHNQSPSKKLQEDKNSPIKVPQIARHRDFQTIVPVVVGPTESKYLVHVSHLVHDSPFFGAMLKGNWKESLDGVVKLPADDPIVFECFLDWIYHGKTTFIGTDHSKRIMFFSKAFVFADKIQALRMKDALLHSLTHYLTKHEQRPDLNTITYVYDNTDTASPLRLTFIFYYVWLGDTSALEHTDLREVPGFLMEVAQGLMIELKRQKARVLPEKQLDGFNGFCKAFHADRQKVANDADSTVGVVGS